MDLKDLRMFLHLSKTLHFARSSRELHISASGLTRSIQRLEQELGVSLFERDKRTVRITREGVVVRDYARDTIERWEVLKNELQSGGSLQGVLSLFCSVTASYSFLHELLQKFRGQFPQIELQLHTGDSAQALVRVADELEEIAIAALPDRLPDNMKFLALGQSPLVCIGPEIDCPVRAELQLAAQSGVYRWRELPLILSETGLARVRLEQWFGHRNINPRVYAQVGGHEAMVSMVSLGCGIAVVPRVVVDNSPLRDHISIVPVMHELEPFTIGLCALRRKFANPLVRAFWSIAEESSHHYKPDSSVYNRADTVSAMYSEDIS